MAPVGLAWEHARRTAPTVRLFVDDGSHPAPAGTYLAACTLAATIVHRNPEGAPARISGPPVNLETERVEADSTAVLVDLPAADALVLQRAAWNAVTRWPDEPTRSDLVPLRAPAPPPLPPTRFRNARDVTGTWTGQLLLHPAGAREITLVVNAAGTALRGSLEVRRRTPQGQDERVTLDENFFFLKKKKKKNFFFFKVQVSYRAVLAGPGELVGRATAVLPRPGEPPVQFVGSFRLTRSE